MATGKLGKLKLNLSKRGLAYRWGDGEVKRLFGSRAKPSAEDDYNEYDSANGDYDEYSDGGYDDGYADDGYADDGYADDGYADDGYADDGYAGDGYDDGGYADDGYADDSYGDGYADDGYGDGYDDGGYADDGYGDGVYDDRYSDEDAGDGYYQNQSPLMQYVDENDWVTYLLLFLFPPLGIYLLWRRNRFDKPIRYAITAASAIWFIVALILLITGILGGRNDEPMQPNITLPPASIAPTASIVGTEEDEDTDEDTSLDVDAGTSDLSKSGIVDLTDDIVQPTATALADASANAALNASEYVYSPISGLYYHSRSDCTNIDAGVSVSRVPKDVAENSRKQSACPVCMNTSGNGSLMYYATRNGSYYHTDEHCSGMTTAVPYTKEAAERAGKTPCPVCVTKTQQSLASGAVKFITASTKDASGISVYATKTGKYYHLTSDCSGMRGASRGSLKSALLAGKQACPTCCAEAGTKVYCTAGGKSYHKNKTCQGMAGAAEVTLGEAMVLGKSKCRVCIKSHMPSAQDMARAADAAADDSTVYGTRNGKYYHTDRFCSGMKNAQSYTLKSMLLQKRQPCPVCASASNTVVYATQGGEYYHSYATCSGMSNASSGTLAQALASGKKRCPRCWSNGSANGASALSGKTSSSSATQTVAAVGSSAASRTATASNTYVYATKGGSYYHLNNGCSGMKGASRITLRQAITAGKKACPTCARSANRKVYSTDGGKYYHAASSCSKSGMKKGQPRTLAQALMLNQTACQYCLGSSAAKAARKASSTTTAAIRKAASKLKNSHRYKSGKSGVKVYTRADSKYYHRRSTCSGMTNASRVTLETAMNYGKKACPKCLKRARKTVYATRGGKYYHASKTHAGVGAKKGSLASALGYGYKPCPYCVTKTKKITRKANYKAGASGIKVYTTTTAKHYHAKRNCSGMTNASRVSLETAMNYGKTACPTCLASASRKVYSSGSDKYYHYYKLHAGSGASSGSVTKARAMGKKLCPVCKRGINTGVSTVNAVSYSKAKVSTKKYNAAGSSKVYISLTGKQYYYYHKSSKCSKGGMKNGTRITLRYAKDWGYKACPYCQPPTGIISGT
ncbi:MAG: hypothetical protein IJJ45_12065 [Clostridia bacterium]|nr:hypothetical protein [Clostridia bacterium]